MSMKSRIAWVTALLAGLALATQALGQANARMEMRTGKAVVDEVCAACHATGKKGAPKIGDRDAWVPRMKRGLHTLTLAAIRGHDGMPARGGRADLTDAEIHNAIAYMFNPVTPPAAAAGTAPSVAARNTRQVTASGIRFDLG